MLEPVFFDDLVAEGGLVVAVKFLGWGLWE